MRQFTFAILLSGCLCAVASNATAYDSDVHYSTTLALALALGMAWPDAKIVASADQGVDENVDTRPTEHVAVGPTLPDQQAQLQFQNVFLGLSLQDYYFHCFSREPDDPGRRHKSVLDHLNDLESQANTAIGKYLEDLAVNAGGLNAPAPERADKVRALISIGVYLHCQQDSWSHSGFGKYPLGHVVADLQGESPDHPANRPDMLTSALIETKDKLSSFMSRWGQQPVTVTGTDIAELTKGMVMERTQKWDSAEWIACNDAVSRYWLEKFGTAHAASGVASLPPDMHMKVAIETKIVRVQRSEGGSYQTTYYGGTDLVSLDCELLMKDAFREIPFTDKIDGELYKSWTTPVSLSLVAPVPPAYPIYTVRLERGDFVNDTDGGYQILTGSENSRADRKIWPGLKIGWIGLLVTVAVLLLIGAAVATASAVRIARKAGYSGLWILIAIFPPAFFWVLWYFAYRAQWPHLRETITMAESGQSEVR
jgi:hypothetical protein